jgi:hypothetical protein
MLIYIYYRLFSGKIERDLLEIAGDLVAFMAKTIK